MTEAHANRSTVAPSRVGNMSSASGSDLYFTDPTPISKAYPAITPEQAANAAIELAKLPALQFKKKTWRHREQEIRIKKQISAIVAKNRPLFVIEPLAKDNRVAYLFSEYDDQGVLRRQIARPKRCRHCLEPATHVERCVEDASYLSFRCSDVKCQQK